MIRLLSIAVAVVCLFAGILLLPVSSQPKGVEKPPAPNREALLRILQQTIDTRECSREKVKLKVALEYFSDKFGGKLPILVDVAAFERELGDKAESPYEEGVILPPVPTRMQMAVALRLVVSQIGQGKATYIVRRDYIEIVPEKYTTAPNFLYQPSITASYDGAPLSKVLDDLADDLGIAINVDPKVAKQAATPIRTTFRNCTLEDALTPITEMAGLKYVVLHRSIYVTTKEHAEVIREEEEIRARKRVAPPNKIKRLESAAE